jgi:hypothetical protein
VVLLPFLSSAILLLSRNLTEVYPGLLDERREAENANQRPGRSCARENLPYLCLISLR